MGIFDRFRKERDYIERGVSGFQFIDTSNYLGIYSDNSKKYSILESIYTRISTDMSLIELSHVVTGAGENGKIQFEYPKDSLQEILQTRPNPYQTVSEFIKLMIYNLYKYSNGIAIINYAKTEDKWKINNLEPLNMAQYKFGVGYEIKDGNIYLGMLDKKTNETRWVNYNDIIHLRLSPDSLFYAEENDLFQGNNIPKIINANINNQLKELQSGNSIRGILKLNNIMSKTDGRTSRTKEFLKTITKGIGSVGVDEDFRELNKNFSTVSSEDLKFLTSQLYAHYGINENIVNGKWTSAEYSAYYNATLEPLTKNLKEEFEYKLLSKTARSRGHRIMARKSLLSGAGLDEITKFIDKLVYEGIINRNEAREYIGLGGINGGDEYTMNKNTARTRRREE